jgi:hypothetical protein
VLAWRASAGGGGRHATLDVRQDADHSSLNPIVAADVHMACADQAGRLWAVRCPLHQRLRGDGSRDHQSDDTGFGIDVDWPEDCLFSGSLAAIHSIILRRDLILLLLGGCNEAASAFLAHKSPTHL